MSDEKQIEKRDIKQEIIDKNRKRYLKPKEEDMTEDQKKEEEALRDLNNGPTSNENRGCTDILCCLLFIAFIGGCVAVTILGFSQGNPGALIYIYDEEGNPCGKSGDKAENYPYLYLYDAIEQLKKKDTAFLNRGICVKQCPINYDTTTLECYPIQNNKECAVKKENIYLSYPWVDKLCVPSKALYDEAKKNKTSTTTTDNTGRTSEEMDSEYTAMGGLINTNFINVDKLLEYVGDLQLVWPIFLACIGIAVVIGFTYLLIIRCCGACIAYVTILLIFATLIGLGVVFQNRMNYYEQLNDDTYYKIMLAFTIIFYSLAGIWFLIIICSCNKIRLAIALTEVGAIFVWKVMSVVFVPFFFFVIVSLYLAYWVALSVFIYSTGEIGKSGNTFLASVKW